MSGELFALRAARAEDAPALGRLHATCWRQTYADLVPAGVLATSTPEARTALWREVLDPIGSPTTHVVVAESDGEMIGFGACGPQRTAELARDGFDGEISALYVRAFAQGRGIGTTIFRALARDLAARDVRAVALWVLCGNAKARRFYERAGGALLGARDARRADGILSEVAYGWRRLDPWQVEASGAPKPRHGRMA